MTPSVQLAGNPQAVIRPPGAPVPPAGTPLPPNTGTPPPVDPNYTTRVGLAQQTLDNTLGTAGYNETALRQQYGFDDSSNPFSVANTLKRNFDIAKRAALNSSAASGQLYSGAAQRAQDRAGYDYEHNLDTARRAYSAGLQGINATRAGAQTQFGTSVADASSASTVAAMQTRPTADEVLTASQRRDKRINKSSVKARRNKQTIR